MNNVKIHLKTFRAHFQIYAALTFYLNPGIEASSLSRHNRSFKIKEHKPFSFYYYFLRLMDNHLLPLGELLLISNLDNWICTKGNHKFHIP